MFFLEYILNAQVINGQHLGGTSVVKCLSVNANQNDDGNLSTLYNLRLAYSLL